MVPTVSTTVDRMMKSSKNRLCRRKKRQWEVREGSRNNNDEEEEEEGQTLSFRTPKRSLKQQQLQERSHRQSIPLHKTPNPVNPNSPLNSTRRSTRRNHNLDGGSPVPDSTDGGDEDDDDDERQQKKQKLLLGLNSSRNNQHYPSHPRPIRPPTGPIRMLMVKIRRRHSSVAKSPPSGPDLIKWITGGVWPHDTFARQKVVVFILDRLQKKDTYGVFSEPVNPEELPDYHEIIAHPMDFLTVRKKLDGGAYTNLGTI
ncbi:hypothetical protein F3Y22_tig00110458pilonHSYRG00268 [Hibiscus syriacus]|uniref:Bromo domain-containing protein n=1 Tax=Hibiscus syriacus TaxID=106335 RepID=A0A6A3AK40_HIBSY|nr:hypothetical protein F3Y22_tig00110458pilonHSYRG00268 [Hibiscus syriacus]